MWALLLLPLVTAELYLPSIVSNSGVTKVRPRHFVHPFPEPASPARSHPNPRGALSTFKASHSSPWGAIWQRQCTVITPGVVRRSRSARSKALVADESEHRRGRPLQVLGHGHAAKVAEKALTEVTGEGHMVTAYTWGIGGPRVGRPSHSQPTPAMPVEGIAPGDAVVDVSLSGHTALVTASGVLHPTAPSPLLH
jgi:hypothetical protein